MAKVAVVILNYNGRDYLDQFLPSVIQHSQEAEVIVADNASSDDSIQFLKDNFAEIRRIELSENLGFAGGYNEALKKVEAEYFVLLNSDVEVSEGWLKSITEFLDQNNSYAACQPKILDFNKKEHFEYAGACGGFLDLFGYPFCRGRVFNSLEKDEGQYDEPTDINWASGACLIVRSKVFSEVGGFDPDFFAHMEEIDLCWRIQSKGHKIKSIPSSVVYHVGGGTLSKSSPFKTYLNFRNGLSLIIKNMPFSQLIWKLPVRILLDWIAALKFLLDGGPRHTLAVFRAHAKALLLLFKTLRKRKKPFTPIATPYSIVFRYFIKQEKRFSDL